MEKIVVTGGSGFLGKALIERLHDDADLTVISRSEKAQLDIRARYPDVRCLIGDVRDRALMERACRGADTMIHAAALKHVNLSEQEPREYVGVNVTGSLVALDAAARYDLRFIGISTDKACEPRNVYGMTKALLERLTVERCGVTVRYGNVFGSDGSVVTRWPEQLARHNRITVTDPEMTRFFFRVGDAVDAVLAAWAAPPGCVVIPPIRAASLGDLAQAFIERAGYGDVQIIGPREGEKKHEQLLSDDEGKCAWQEPDGYTYLRPNTASDSPVPGIRSDEATRIPIEELISWLG